MQRQIGRIGLHLTVEFCHPDTNRLGREPGPRHPFDRECIARARWALLPLELAPRRQCLPSKEPTLWIMPIAADCATYDVNARKPWPKPDRKSKKAAPAL